jgi:hypothetical protein
VLVNALAEIMQMLKLKQAEGDKEDEVAQVYI